MKKFTVLLVIYLTLVFSGIGAVQAEESFWSWLISFKRQKGIAVIKDEIYNEECSACHFAYQPGLLPERSWRRLLTAKALEDHFGENAELDDETRLHIIDVVVKNASDKSYYKRAKKIRISIPKDEAPMRITKVPYIKEKHHEVTEEVLATSTKIKTLSFCDKCHQLAEKGIYDDDTVVIPGYGTWTW